MTFAHDTRASLVWTAALINTDRDGVDHLPDVQALDGMLVEHEWSGRRDGTEAELGAVRALRAPLRAMWTFEDLDTLVADINVLLTDSGAAPRLARHGDWGWHLHVTHDDAPLAHRLMAESGIALAELVRVDELHRLKACESPNCDAVLIDLSRNRSRRFCDTGNCGNRENVHAYRERKRRKAV